jgi:hypothetical protein
VKVYNKDVELSDLPGGFPQHDHAGKDFTAEDFNRLRVEIRPVATKLDDEVSLDR